MTIQHTLLVSDHEMLKIKYSDTSENAPNSYEQYQRQIDDWHNKFKARDADVKLLTRQVEKLKNVIVTQGLTMPPPEPVSAPAPASTKAPVPALSNPNELEEFPIPGPGWQFGGASRAANRPNWGNVPLPEPIHDNGGGDLAITCCPVQLSRLFGFERRTSISSQGQARWEKQQQQV